MQAERLARRLGRENEDEDECEDECEDDGERREQMDEIREVIEAAGEIALPLEGRSMGPQWAAAHGVRVAACRLHPPAWGWVVLIRRGERVLAHRMLARLGDRYVTKGDARLAWDRPLARRSEILGVVIALLPGEIPIVRQRAIAVREAMKALLAWPLLPVIRRLRGRDERRPESA